MLQSDNFESMSSFIKSFDAMVKPIILYGCDVWGIEDILKSLKRTNSRF